MDPRCSTVVYPMHSSLKVNMYISVYSDLVICVVYHLLVKYYYIRLSKLLVIS